MIIISILIILVAYGSAVWLIVSDIKTYDRSDVDIKGSGLDKDDVKKYL